MNSELEIWKEVMWCISGFKPAFALGGTREKHGNPQSGQSPYRGSSLERQGYASGTQTTGLWRSTAGVRHNVSHRQESKTFCRQQQSHLWFHKIAEERFQELKCVTKLRDNFSLHVYTTHKHAHARVSLTSFKAYLFLCLFPYSFISSYPSSGALLSPFLLFISPSFFLSL